MQLVRQKPTLKLHQVHIRFKNMMLLLSQVNAMAPALESLHHQLYRIQAVADLQTAAVEYNPLGIFQPHTWSSLTLFSNICSQVCQGFGPLDKLPASHSLQRCSTSLQQGFIPRNSISNYVHFQDNALMPLSTSFQNITSFKSDSSYEQQRFGL